MIFFWFTITQRGENLRFRPNGAGREVGPFFRSTAAAAERKIELLFFNHRLRDVTVVIVAAAFFLLQHSGCKRFTFPFPRKL